MADLDKKLEMCMLADIYGGLLTQNQQQVISSYYASDYSLFEIAENLGITRQAVRDTLKKAETALLNAEQKCGFASKSARLKTLVQKAERQVKLGAAKPVVLATIKQIADNL